MSLRPFLVVLVLLVHSLSSQVLNTSQYYLSATRTVECTTTTIKNEKLAFSTKCSNKENLKVRKLGSVKLSLPLSSTWRATCTTACLKLNTCVGFTTVSVGRNVRACTLLGGKGCDGLEFSSVKKNLNMMVTLSRLNCFTPLTNSPTRLPTVLVTPSPTFSASPTSTLRPTATYRPTSRQPTRLTEAPVPNCKLPDSSPFANEFAQLEGYPVNLNSFRLMDADFELCEYVRLAYNSVFQTIENFPCSEEACIRWCSYYANCKNVAYSSVDKTCVRSTYMELTDDSMNFLPYHKAGTKAWMRNSQGIRPLYFSGRCNELTPVTCGQDEECGWNQGKRGYNDQLQGGSSSGYCGRVKCLAAQTKR